MILEDHASDRSAPRGKDRDRRTAKVYLVGGGIASLAAAAFMIRDGDVPGHNITILEELDNLGGSLDGSGSPQNGYVLRGGRMLESKYRCTYELFSSIPTLDESRTVTQEIFEWNETMKTSSKSRLVQDGHRQTAPEFGLSERHIFGGGRCFELRRPTLAFPEARKRIAQCRQYS
jgi:oleate hydratase